MFEESPKEAVLAPEIAAGPIHGLEIRERPARLILRLEWPLALHASGLPERGWAGRLGDAQVLFLGPNWLWLVSDSGEAQESLAESLSATVTDISHGQVALSLTASGSGVLAWFDGLTPLDLTPARFAPGRVARTNLLGHTAVLHRLEESAFYLYLDRSYAQSFWEAFTVAARSL